MAQMILTQIGASLGGPVGAYVGKRVGAFIDQQVAASLLPGHAVGRRLSGLQLNNTAEGAPVIAGWGRVRVGAQVIWAARFKESRVDQSSGGGKSGALAGGGGTYRYSYSLSFAVGLCEGPVDGIGRIWADGKVLDTSHLTLRTYLGGQTQTPDPLIAAVEGDAPAYRGLAYLVFEDLNLDPFGARPPAISAEIFRRPVWPGGPPALEDRLQGVCLIPGAGESVYATTPVQRITGLGRTVAENVNAASGGADLLTALDQLQAQLPKVVGVNLVSAWFGDDLRCGVCQVRPGVESAAKHTLPLDWRAGGVDRSGARLVSQVNGGPAYGGTPSDASLIAAIAELKARGLAVTFYPFLLMDVAQTNTLPDPYGGAAQGAYPWRGRITGHLAPGRLGSPDRTAQARTEVNAFFGQARASEFRISGGTVAYAGADGWTWRRMALHQAALCVAAGGVDSFVIGSEFRGLTTLRDDAGAYPAVEQLVALARECRTLLGPAVKIGYAADWTEYYGHQPTDGSGDVFFHLDPLWSDPAISFVGIDWYAPVTDWRDGTQHLDAQVGYAGTADPAYLAARITGGEAYDWYYASDAARLSQTRSPITDGAYGEPWVFRPKDLAGWWSHAHYNRPKGVRSATPTAWTPGMKPVRLVEFGCAAIDKGANAPNRFLDPKSSESLIPPFSSGVRDDLGQRRMLEALLAHFAVGAPGNPVSPVYGGPMIAAGALAAWCWDARPYPEFPARDNLWSDAPNWTRGHWLTGRAGTGDLADLIASLLARGGIDPATVDLSGAVGLVQGFAVNGPARLIDTLTELALAFPFDMAERGGRIAFVARDGSPVARLDASGLALPTAAPADAALTPGLDPVRRERGLVPAPDLVRVRFADAHRDYQTGQANARTDQPDGGGGDALDLPLVMSQGDGLVIGARRLRRRRAERDTATVAIGPDLAHRLEPGDQVTLGTDPTPWRVKQVAFDGGPRLLVEGVEAPDAPLASLPVYVVAPPAPPAAAPAVALIDLPPLPGAEADIRPLLAVTADPWAATDVSAGPSTASLALRARFTAPSPLGVTLSPLTPGPLWRLDLASQLAVQIHGYALASQPLEAVLAGANAAAVQALSGEWELIQYLDAVQTGPDQWALSRLLRGQAGTDPAMGAGAASGAAFAPLTPQLVRADMAQSDRGLALSWRAAPAGTTAAGPSSTDFAGTWTGLALRPWSPCHLTATLAASGDIALSWIRRARLFGDSLDDEPPLGEESEQWRIDVAGPTGGPVRTLMTTTAQASYAAADQRTDFPQGPLRPLHFTVRQGSATFGWGAPSTVLLP